MAFSDYFDGIQKLKLYGHSYNTALYSGHRRAAGHMNSQWLGQYAQKLGKPTSHQNPARRKESGTQFHPQSCCCVQYSLEMKQISSSYLRLMQTE